MDNKKYATKGLSVSDIIRDSKLMHSILNWFDLSKVKMPNRPPISPILAKTYSTPQNFGMIMDDFFKNYLPYILNKKVYINSHNNEIRRPVSLECKMNREWLFKNGDIKIRSNKIVHISDRVLYHLIDSNNDWMTTKITPLFDIPYHYRQKERANRFRYIKTFLNSLGNYKITDSNPTKSRMLKLELLYKNEMLNQYKEDMSHLKTLLFSIPLNKFIAKNKFHAQIWNHTLNFMFDILIDDSILEIKCVKDFKIKNRDFCQLIIYETLYSIGGIDSELNRVNINNIGIYFVRHGFLWKQPISDFISTQKHKKFIAWFKTEFLKEISTTNKSINPKNENKQNL